MHLKLFNSLTRSLELFNPINPEHVKMYVCGPTVYDNPHIGNARPIVVFDILYRVLKTIYPKVTYVRNITDVDDKINARSAKLKISISDLTKNVYNQFKNNIEQLNVLNPDIEPFATEHIKEMILMISRLIEKGHAYVANNHVLFKVRSINSYGCLSNRNLNDMIAGARVEVAPYKEDPLDFVLWKPSGDDIPGWESPWGRGRPGWHIECSAMSAKYLGEEFDLHGGGQDLTFPHNENEIAQSKAYSGKMLAHTWIHNNMVLVNGQKMSKSLGNVITLSDALFSYQGEVIRYFLLNTHYSKPLDWTEEGLKQAATSLNRLYGSLNGLRNNNDMVINNHESEVLNALCDDLNTPKALSILHSLANEIYKGNKEKQILLKQEAKILGILQEDPETWFHGAINNSEIEDLIEKRRKAKENKNFDEADLIRSQLSESGIIIEDCKDGTTRWKLNMLECKDDD